MIASARSFFPEVVVINGTGALGLAAARRVGLGRHIVLADLPGATLDHAAAALGSSGHDYTVCPTDVSDPSAVAELVGTASHLGPIRTIVHTAGLAPSQASAADILRVNLYGVALVLDAFHPHAGVGTVIVCISSQGGYRMPVSPSTERLMAVTSTVDLLDLAALQPSRFTEAEAYAVSKRGVHVRVEAESRKWAARGARAVSVSPGFTVTPQSVGELDGPQGDLIRGMFDRAGTRAGTPDDIAGVIEYLCSPSASFINGIDVRVDGGFIASERWSDPERPGPYFPEREPF